MYVHADEDPRRYAIELSYNTSEHYHRSIQEASDAEEARWNYAFWLQSEVAALDEMDTVGRKLQTAWLNERGLNYTDAEEESNFDRCMKLADCIWDELLAVCSSVGYRLHTSGIITQKFGRTIPIIIHDLEYYDKLTKVTLASNPPGVADEFVRWVDALG